MNLDWKCIFGCVSQWVIILMQWTCVITLYLLHCVDSEGHAVSQPVLLTDKLHCLSQ